MAGPAQRKRKLKPPLPVEQATRPTAPSRGMKFSDWRQEWQAQQAPASASDLAHKPPASGAELGSGQGSEDGEARGRSAARSVPQQDVGGSIQVQPAHELATVPTLQPQSAHTTTSQGLQHAQARAQEADRGDATPEQIVSQADDPCLNGHKLRVYMTPHSEHSCGVCDLPVPVQALVQRCEECDYDMCCTTPMKHTKEPTDIPTELPTDMPTELQMDTPTELADLQAGGKWFSTLCDM